MLEVIDYMEQFKVIESTEKNQDTKKMVMGKSEGKNDQSKTKSNKRVISLMRGKETIPQNFPFSGGWGVKKILHILQS